MGAEESGLDEEAISFLVNSWWKPKCCGSGGATAESQPPKDESSSSSGAVEEPAPEVEEPSVSENESSPKDDKEMDVSSAFQGFSKNPWSLCLVGSAVSVLSVVLFG